MHALGFGLFGLFCFGREKKTFFSSVLPKVPCLSPEAALQYAGPRRAAELNHHFPELSSSKYNMTHLANSPLTCILAVKMAVQCLNTVNDFRPVGLLFHLGVRGEEVED